jgi:hypothetical protein
MVWCLDRKCGQPHEQHHPPAAAATDARSCRELAIEVAIEVATAAAAGARCGPCHTDIAPAATEARCCSCDTDAAGPTAAT